MELFVAFMQVKGVRGTLCKLLLKVDDFTKPAQPNLPFTKTIEWACNKSQYPKTILMTLDFLSELFQVCSFNYYIYVTIIKSSYYIL